MERSKNVELTDNLEEVLEEQHVHQVYEQIASHFSETRYKPWPVVDNFLKEMPDFSLGADIGCGNGKYLGVNEKLCIIGTDRCKELTKICKEKGFECFVANNLSLPFKSSTFDFAISIAVIHHFSSENRRKSAIKELIRILKPGGKLLIFVWAFEQKSRRNFETQDVFVSWQLTKKKSVESSATKEKDECSEEPPTFDRYYHLFKQGELDALVNGFADFQIEQSGYDRDNWYIIGRKLHDSA